MLKWIQPQEIHVSIDAIHSTVIHRDTFYFLLHSSDSITLQILVLQAKHDARAYPAAIIAAGEAIGVNHNEVRVEAFEGINVEPKEFMTRVEKN